METRWNRTSPPEHGFAGLPVCTSLDEVEADIALLGLRYRSPYPRGQAITDRGPDTESTTGAMRRRSQAFVDHLDHYDFNFNDPLLGRGEFRIVDCGDLRSAPGAPGAPGALPEQITHAVRAILQRKALPVVFGDDEGGIIPVLKAYEGQGALCVVHIDAHIDWLDQRDGVREGYSSGMRRASEMPWVKAMAQIGLRGVGSARQQEVDDAVRFGSIFIRAREIHEKGAAACLERLPSAERYLVTIDFDALDPSIAPGVLFPTPGGLSFFQVSDLVREIAARGRVAGINLFEARPELDVADLTVNTAVHLLLDMIGILIRSGRVGR